MVAAVSDNPLDNSLDNLIDNLSGNSMDNSLGNPTLLDLVDGCHRDVSDVYGLFLLLGKGHADALRCISDVRDLQRIIPLKVTFQGWTGLLKSKLCPVFIGISANQSDVSFLRNEKVPKKTKINGKDGRILPRI